MSRNPYRYSQQPAGGSSVSMLEPNSALHSGSIANLSEKNSNPFEDARQPATATGMQARNGSGRANNSRRKTWIILGAVIGTLVVIGAVVGGVLAVKLRKDNTSTTGSSHSSSGINNVAADSNNALTSILPNGQTTTIVSAAASATSSSSSAQASVSPLATYDWTKSSYAGAIAQAKSAGANSVQGPMVGIALGSWLILEQWMLEPWFNASANYNSSVVDEWNLMLALGDNATAVMKQHWDTWITEDDIETAYQAGINHLRIPIGFWAFIDTIAPEPYLAKAGQLDYLEQAMSWAYKRNMYVIIDLHGLPGSQNGEITSGVRTTNPHFFTDQGQSRSDDTVDAALAWIAASPYRSVVSALGVANEPRPYTQQQINMLQSYYQRAYDKSTNMSNPVPIQFHHGFVDQILKNVTFLSYWRSFVANKDPRYINMETHPYIGTFPIQTNQQDMLNQVCNNANNFASYPVPIAITEWSVRTGVSDPSFEKTFYKQQATAWANTGGGIFWSMKAVNGSANNGDNSQYNFQTLLSRGIVPTPSNGQSAFANLQNMGSPCGTPPTPSWAS